MEFGQSVTAPIQYVPNRAPPGHYLAPELMGFGCFHVLLGLPLLLLWWPQGETLPLPAGCECCLWVYVISPISVSLLPRQADDL